MGLSGANPTGQLVLWGQETPEEVGKWAKSQKKKKKKQGERILSSSKFERY